MIVAVGGVGVDVAVGGAGVAVGTRTVGTSGVGFVDADPISGVDVDSGGWTVGVVVPAASGCVAGIGDGPGPGSTRAMGVAGGAVSVGETTSTFAGVVVETALPVDLSG